MTLINPIFTIGKSAYAIKESKPVKAKGFVPLKLAPSPSASDGVPSLFAEVKGIRLYQVVSSEYLKALLS